MVRLRARLLWQGVVIWEYEEVSTWPVEPLTADPLYHYYAAPRTTGTYPYREF